MLNIDEIIKKKDLEKEKKARAEGSLERVMSDLEAKHGIKTINEVKTNLEKFKADVANNEKRQEEILTEINEAVNWDEI